MVAQFTEVETGKRNARPELEKAKAACLKHKAKLVIAKLDRLSRNVAFLSAMMDGKIEFIACDNPTATRLTLHILAAVAEHEAEVISQRTIAALQAAKRRGVVLGRGAPGSRQSGRSNGTGLPVNAYPGRTGWHWHVDQTDRGRANGTRCSGRRRWQVAPSDRQPRAKARCAVSPYRWQTNDCQSDGEQHDFGIA
jgi:hypothetical protein